MKVNHPVSRLPQLNAVSIIIIQIIYNDKGVIIEFSEALHQERLQPFFDSRIHLDGDDRRYHKS